MRNAPFVSALRDEHVKARWPRYGFAVCHSRERIKPVTRTALSLIEIVRRSSIAFCCLYSLWV